jgi:hypothetical protein
VSEEMEKITQTPTPVPPALPKSLHLPGTGRTLKSNSGVVAQPGYVGTYQRDMELARNIGLHIVVPGDGTVLNERDFHAEDGVLWRNRSKETFVCIMREEHVQQVGEAIKNAAERSLASEGGSLTRTRLTSETGDRGVSDAQAHALAAKSVRTGKG